MNTIAAGVAIGLVTIFQGCSTPITTETERSPELQCAENLVLIDGAKEQLALEKRLTNGTTVTMEALIKRNGGYLEAPLTCPSGGTYDLHPVGDYPTCSVPGHKIVYQSTE